MAADPMSRWTIRPFRTHQDYEACIALQEATWGTGFSERVPMALMIVSQRLGGVAAGAFDEDGSLAGFIFGLSGIEDGSPVHWSDMLAVRTDCRGRGLGIRLKSYQRDVVLEKGIRRMYWTFDPLESQNAYINLARLGIVAREYVENMYGQTDSPLHRGIGTDRFVALWQLDAPRVERRLGEEGSPPAIDELAGVPRVLEGTPGSSSRWPEPEARETRRADQVLAAIPSNIQALKAATPELAARWREATRSVLQSYLSNGYEVCELIRGARVSHYLLRRIGETNP
ncbi:MAG: GNAT family N-acetyltransferase [Gammaproteobacteria bacterium]|nr:GNAT family N-acetyltransferase [Gammaproteobacteria bacterium]MYC53935.1 GNAT family N-acetyltransferase [Gammaproteobacteria bacterium]